MMFYVLKPTYEIRVERYFDEDKKYVLLLFKYLT